MTCHNSPLLSQQPIIITTAHNPIPVRRVTTTHYYHNSPLSNSCTTCHNNPLLSQQPIIQYLYDMSQQPTIVTTAHYPIPVQPVTTTHYPIQRHLYDVSQQYNDTCTTKCILALRISIIKDDRPVYRSDESGRVEWEQVVLIVCVQVRHLRTVVTRYTLHVLLSSLASDELVLITR